MGPAHGLVDQPEGTLECLAIVGGKAIDIAEHGPEQLMESGERKMSLGLDSRGTKYFNSRRRSVCPSRFEQRRLADAGNSAHDQSAAASISRGLDSLGERSRLRLAPDQIIRTQGRTSLPQGQ
jgi:hypothetical protein